MRICLFYHSLISDWNHGHAHSLRGIVTELIARGHDVTVYEPRNAWSVENLVAEYGEAPLLAFREAFPELHSVRYDSALDLDKALDGADLVIVHDWNDLELVNRIGEHHKANAGYTLLFHDTHYRAAAAPQRVGDYDLSHYDGVLAVGAVLRDAYLASGRAKQAWVWHEAADTRHSFPAPSDTRAGDVVWVGNWGNQERTADLYEFLLNPVQSMRLKARVYGVQYPYDARAALAAAGVEYAGWLPGYLTPQVFAQFAVTIHLPRRAHARELAGVPTSRVFEALACGIPLISAPWDDVEGLFTAGTDYLVARDGEHMRELLRDVLNDSTLAASLAENGLRTIRERHTCAHRVDELMAIVESLGRPVVEPNANAQPRQSRKRLKQATA